MTNLVNDVRKKFGLSQIEFALLLDIPIGTIRNHEQGVRGKDSEINSAFKTLLNLLSGNLGEEVFRELLASATLRKYQNIKEVRAVLSTIKKSNINSVVKSLREIIVLKNNEQFTPAELGFTVVVVTPKKS